MNTTELKQYIEKELHNKRFLTEGLEFINQLENAQKELKDIGKQIDAENGNLETVRLHVRKVSEELKSANEAVKSAKDKATEVTNKATAQAEAIIKDANIEAAKIAKKTHDDLAKVRDENKNLTEENATLRKTNEELKGVKEVVSKDMEKLRKKLS